MGFAKAGRHVSKDVTLYRQGGINLVVNTEREGFAHSAYLTHGVGVCDIGFRVEDAAATVARAAALGAQTFQQPHRPGRARPSRRSAASAARSCTSSTRARRSHGSGRSSSSPPTTTSAVADAGLLAVDHLAQTMPYDEMLSWVLFYTSIFRHREGADGRHHRPLGRRPQPGDRERRRHAAPDAQRRREHPHLRRPLHRRDRSARPSSTSPSPARDIFATAAALRRQRLRDAGDHLELLRRRRGPLRPRPRLRRPAAGRATSSTTATSTASIFQLYSPNFGEGFFFEIVERRGGYRGYGAPNAPFRIAAQKRHLRPKGMPRA